MALPGGQKRRFALAIGLVHRPPLIFLDEPTTGLDPQNRANLWDEVRALRDQGTSVLLTTHYLDEADALCDRLVIIDHGVIVAEGTPEKLKKEVAGDVVTLRLDDLTTARELLTAQPYIKETRTEDDTLRAYLDDGEHNLPALLRALENGGLTIRSISLARPTLDDVFLRHTGISYGLALAVRDEGGMSQIVQFFALPLTLLAGMLLPVSLGPQWMQTAARFNPLYYSVEAGRSLFAGDLSDGTIPTAFGLFVVLGVLALAWAIRSLRGLAG